MTRIHAIILAAGEGNRFGAEMPKQFVRLAGEPILLRAMRTVSQISGLERLVVVAHPEWLRETNELVEQAGVPIQSLVVPGGVTRNVSTQNGLRALHAEPDDVVLVHDAVRPLVPADVVLRSIEPIVSGRADATDTVIASADTLVIVEDDEVVEIPDRSRYRRGQTPQAFRAGILTRAYDAAAAAGDLSATDDCSLVLRHVPGARIVAVDGDEINVKITTRVDMIVADRMIQMRTLSPANDPTPVRSLEGARVYVVGGTNGIGQAIAEGAQRLGARTAVDGRSTGLDVRDYAAVEAHVNAAAERLAGLDHVVCTVGLLRIGPACDTDPAELAEVIDVNLTGTLNVARAAHHHLAPTRGSLTLFASSSFTLGRPNYVAYSASKAAVVNLSQGLAEEWATDGVRVNVVSPERTDTPMRRRAFPNESPVGLLPMQDVASATLRLMRSNLTGQVLDVRRNETVGQPIEITADSVPALPTEG